MLKTITLLTAALVATSASAQGDATKGERSFRKCQACHVVEEGAANRVGPNLYGVVGREAAALENYDYSDAMVEAAENGLVWDEESLDAFIAQPRDVVPGTKMTFAGIRNEGERQDLIAYLATLGGEEAEG